MLGLMAAAFTQTATWQAMMASNDGKQ